jgi:hypothetical protein
MQASTIHKKNPLELAMAARKNLFLLKTIKPNTRSGKWGQGKWEKRGQGANLDRIQGVDFEGAGAAPAGVEAGTGILGEVCEFHHGRVVSLAAGVWQVQGAALSGGAGGCGIALVLEWLAESTNERSSAMGRWDLGQLENGTVLEDAAFLDLEIQEHAGDVATGLVVFQQPEIALYQRLLEAARNRLTELEYGIEKSKVDSIRSKLLGVLRTVYPIKEKRDAHSPKPPGRLFYFPQCPTRDGMECQTVCSPVRPRCGGRGRRRCQVFLALLNSLY